MRLGSVIIQFNGTGSTVLFEHAMVDTSKTTHVLVHFVYKGVSGTYVYQATDIKALIVLPGDWLRSDVDKLAATLKKIR